MKRVLGCLLLLSALACNEQRGQPAPSSPRPALVPKDSAGLQRDSLNPYAPVDVSPMDMAYFPVNYTVQRMMGEGESLPVARVIYSRPHRQNRRIFGSLLKYGEPWRLGANEATEIELFRNVSITGKRVAKGRYMIYAIPYIDKWVIVFNRYLYSWGLTPHPEHDAYRFEIPIQITRQPIEFFSMAFQETEGGADLVIAWDTVVARLPLQF
jgi:hypothetical protein